MEIHCLGLNHKTAPIGTLEKLHFSEDQVRSTLARCGCGDQPAESDPLELALLSTCNRVEVYALLRGDDPSPLLQILAESAELSQKEIEPHLYHHRGLDAVHHLLRVAAGLDSMVIGETQVLGQVANAYTLALQASAAGIVINRALQTAIHGGKRARAETGISTNPSTTSSVAVHFAASIVRDIQSSQVLVIGAGEMAELTVEALRKRGVDHLTVINRTVARARELANRWDATARSFEHLTSSLSSADIVITSTGAPHPILSQPLVRESMSLRQDRPIVILDIAVPRDVDPSVGELAQVHLYDLEHLNQHLKGSLGERINEVPAVETILEQELQTFAAWYDSIGVRPLISELHQWAETLRSQELERTLPRLESLTLTERETVEAMTRALVKKILHSPTLRLKEQSQNGTGAAYGEIVRDLFDLQAEPDQSSAPGILNDSRE